MSSKPVISRDAIADRVGRSWQILRGEQMQIAILSVAVGAIAAYGAIGIRVLIGWVQWVFYQEEAEKLFTAASTLPWWQVLLAPAVGGMLVGLFIRYALPERRPLGVADVIEAAALKDGVLSLRRGLLASVANAASVGCGASVGREGPVVLLGASLASTIGRRLKMTRSTMLTLLGCGVAAAVAASFNAPLAGALFALEVVVGHYRLRAFAPVVIASVTGTVVSRSHYGSFPAFIKPEIQIESFWEFPAFGLLGIACAAAAIILMASIMLVARNAHRISIPQWIKPAIAGLIIGAIAIPFPQVLGVGYEATDTVLKGGFSFWLLFGIVIAKIAATAVSVGGGFGGGVFSPSLVLGAMLGAAFGIVASAVFPELASDRGAYTLVGMGAVAGAVLGAPISTILIVFELTGDYQVTIAVMVAVVIASILSQAVLGKSFFQWQLERRGIMVQLDYTDLLLHRTQMTDLAEPYFPAASVDISVAEARSMLQSMPARAMFLLDEDGRLQGEVAMRDLLAFARGGGDDMAGVVNIARTPPVLLAEDDLIDAADIFARTNETVLPLVDDHETRRMIGFVRQRAVMRAYHAAHEKARED